ncbi:MAG: hypothetical protein LBK99_15215 [Opitutaceae bacterium]|nr:hypothetical protein [Opitutaceae bacterium]
MARASSPCDGEAAGPEWHGHLAHERCLSAPTWRGRPARIPLPLHSGVAQAFTDNPPIRRLRRLRAGRPRHFLVTACLPPSTDDMRYPAQGHRLRHPLKKQKSTGTPKHRTIRF